ncbi:MAG: gliding motility-associated C-terminal domain-containing protein [Saprospiraceae bacterium]|nr:gliding motility-associated C-terminal domain-containing protein [Saprospiraceae bacterium]
MKQRLHRIFWLALLCLPGLTPLYGQFDFSYPGPGSFSLDSNCEAILDFDGMPPVVTSNIGANIVPPTGVDAVLTGYALNGVVDGVQTLTVAFIAADDMSNVDTFYFDIDFVDGIAPVFNNPPPANLVVDCYGDIPAPFIMVAEDNCDGSIFANAVDTPPLSGPNCVSPIVITRSWTATDDSGNATTISHQITVGVDNEAPTIGTPPADGSGDCAVANAAYNTWLITQQNTILATGSDNCNVLTLTHDGPPFVAGDCQTIVVTFMLEDGCGQVATASASFEIIDNNPPVLANVPMDTTIACGEQIPVAPTVTASDNCDLNLPAVSFNSSDDQTANGSCSDANYTITRTWSVSDNCGNMAMETQVITVVDTVAPLFTVPVDTTLDCGSDVSPATTGEIDPLSISDNCLAGFIIGFSDDSTTLGCPQNLDIARTWMVGDSCGNIRSIVQHIFLIDTIAPSFTPPAQDTIYLACDASTNPADTGMPTDLADNCDAQVSLTHTDLFTDQVCTNSFTILRTWYVEDACGNIDSTQQHLILQDLLAPVFTQAAADENIDCTTNADAEQAFADWVAANGNALAVDNCSNSISWMAVNAGTNVSPNLPPTDCMPVVIGVYRQQTVDFIVIDECLNADTTTATFTVFDNTPPSITSCPQNTTIGTDPGVCEGTILLTPPNIVEGCGNEPLNLSYEQALMIMGPGGMVDTLETPISNLNFQIGVASSPVQASGDVTLTISLENVDAESPTEFLLIYGEDGSFLGNTNLTPVQCDSSQTTFTISASTFNAWAFDGIVEITAIPNDPAPLPGRFTVNAICSGGTVRANLAYPATSPEGTRMEYSVDGGPRILVDPIGPFFVTLPLGTNPITYYVTDCAGNESTCSFEITVEDMEPPVIDCPDDFSVSTDLNECTALVEIPIPEGVTDNCAVTELVVATQPSNPQDAFMTFTINPNLGVYNADDKAFIFTGLSPTAVGDVILSFTITGDIESAGEYFEILDPMGNPIGTTEIGQPHVTPGDCNTPSVATFIIPAATFNNWALFGFFAIVADSNIDFPVPPPVPDPGINPCNPGAVNNNGDPDGISTISCTLSYGTVIPTFFATGATTIPNTELTSALIPPVEELNQGVTTVSYIVSDFYGNIDTCSFDITVSDNQAPTAACQSSIVYIDPSGLVTDAILPEEVDAGSFDNCAIQSLSVSPDLITCDMIGDTIQVVLTVVDESGNTAGCNGFVRVEGEAPEPSFFIAACGSDTLFLFANPPGNPNNYIYSWTGPGFSSSQANPVIPNVTSANQGTYTVTIEGLTGCKSDGEIQVPISDLPVTPVIFFTDNDICSNNNIVLKTTAPPGGSSLQYQWYSGDSPNGFLLATTSVPSYTYPGPHMAGDSCFYVIIIRDGCVSNPSASECVHITAVPTAQTNDAVIDVCEGGVIVLGSPSTGPGYMYHWVGPDNYESFSQNPAAILSAELVDDGLYTLTTSVNGCISAPAFTVVNVLEKPETPEVGNNTSVNQPACIGDTIILMTNLEGLTTYLWDGPGTLSFQTDTSILILENAIQSYAGNWTLEVVDNLCVSDPSEPTTVFVSNLPVVQALSNSPVCDNEQLMLSVNQTPGAIYEWEMPNQQILIGQQQTINNPIAGVYTVTVTSNVGCENTDDVSVIVNEAPTITSVSNNAPACPEGPTDVCLFATIFPEDDGTYDYQWMNINNMVVSVDSVGKLLNAIPALVNGEYTLEVTDGNGCVTESAPTLIDMGFILADPTTPVPNPLASSYCEGDVISLQTTDLFQGASEIYQWITPVGNFQSSGPSIQLPPLTLDNDGSGYAVYVVVDGCETDTSALSSIAVNPIPSGTVTSNSPVCQGDQILLQFVNCIPGAEYEWFGPPPFSSSNCNPVIPNANPAQNTGTYTLVVDLDGCVSEPLTTFVTVNNSPTKPVVNNSGDVCIDAPGASLTLSITPASSTPGALYAWYYNGQSIGLPSGLLTLTITDFSQFSQGQYEFTAVAILNDCESPLSVPTIVNMYETPSSVANAGPNVNFCENEQVLLNATPPSQGTGLWSQQFGNPAGAMIVNPDMGSTSVMGTVAGSTYNFIWSLSNGACVNYSVDTMQVFIDIIEAANAGADIEICDGNSVNLNSFFPVTGIASWSQPGSQADLGVVIVDPQDPQTQITGLVPGNTYLFFWTLADNGCGISVDEVEVFVSDAESVAGQDFFECGDGCTFLGASEPAIAQGMWSSPDPDITFEDVFDNQSEVCNLSPGENIFIWTLNNGDCGPDGVDTVIVQYKYLPLAETDNVLVEFADFITFDVSTNDFIPNDYFIEALTSPEHGILTDLGNGQFSYQAENNYIGPDEFTYQLCSESCDCSEATVFFDIGRDAACVVPSIITPNGDGVNDDFVVPCLAESNAFPNSEVSIFNQWGDEVFRASPYLNNWNGMYNGEPVPVGTYFYVLNFGDGSQIKTGFLVVHR